MKAKVIRESDLPLAISHLEKENLIAIPTETVYGLAGNAFSEAATLKTFQAKNRPHFDPLIVHFKKEYLSSPFSHLVSAEILKGSTYQEDQKKEIESLWRAFSPGPFTLILKKNKKISDLVTSGSTYVALRCPSHTLTQKLLSKLPFPLTAPSANRFGRISPTKASDVIQELGNEIDFVLDGGECEVGVESSIFFYDESDSQVHLMRPGKVSAKDVEEVLKRSVLLGNKTLVSSPGTLKSHYAPQKKLFLFKNDDEISDIHHSFVLHLFPSSLNSSYTLSSSSSWEEVARKLFQSLRLADASEKKEIWIQDPRSIDPNLTHPLSYAIFDRLKKASAPR